MKRKILPLLHCLVVIFLCTHSYAQLTDYSSSLSQFRSKFPGADLVAVNFTEEYNFKLASADSSRISGQVSVNQTLVPVKDYPKYVDAIFYNDQEFIETVKVSDSKNKTVKFMQQCMGYKTEDIFHSDQKVCYYNIPFEAKGSAIQYSYQKNYKDVKYLTSVYFHEQVPLEKKTIVFNIPDWLQVDLREFNFDGYKIQKKIEQDASAHVTRHVYSIENLPGFVREYNSPNWAIMFPHIIVVCKGFTDKGQQKTHLASAKDLYSWYKSLCGDIGNKPDELKAIVAELTKDKKTDIEKVESMFYWVQEKIRYIAFEDGIMGFKPQPAQMVFSNKYGDCKGKANLLAQMLKLAGYDARLTWIGTADLPYDYSLPSLAVDNHMICTLILNGKRYFLDGTEENIALNDYAHRIQGKQVMIEDGNSYIIDKVPEFTADRNKQSNVYKLRLEENQLKGNSIQEYNGESKIGMVGAYNAIRTENKKNSFENFLRSGNDNIILANIKEPDWKNRQKPLQVSFDLTLDHQVTKAGKEIYISLDWEKELCSLEFDSTRKTDYELAMKYCIQTQTEFQIPAGHKVDYLPAAVTIKQADYSFEGSYVQKANTIVYSKKILVHKPLLRKKEFAAWNDYVKKMAAFCNEQIVLVKE